MISLLSFQLPLNFSDDEEEKNEFFSTSANLEDLVVGQPEFDQFLLLDETLRIFIRKDISTFMIFIIFIEYL